MPNEDTVNGGSSDNSAILIAPMDSCDTRISGHAVTRPGACCLLRQRPVARAAMRRMRPSRTPTTYCFSSLRRPRFASKTSRLGQRPRMRPLASAS